MKTLSTEVANVHLVARNPVAFDFVAMLVANVSHEGERALKHLRAETANVGADVGGDVTVYFFFDVHMTSERFESRKEQIANCTIKT